MGKALESETGREGADGDKRGAVGEIEEDRERGEKDPVVSTW